MTKHWFYLPIAPPAGLTELDAENAHHAAQVLRLKPGHEITLTDGMGGTFYSAIREISKKHCLVEVLESQQQAVRPGRVAAMAVSPLKNMARFEWFLEKATELGISEIFPVHCTHTVRANLRLDRCRSICINAMLQSQQPWMPEVHRLQPLENMLNANFRNRWIAHCAAGAKQSLNELVRKHDADALLMIGPEGDFSSDEIIAFVAADFLPVSLGDARLRTETAAVVGASFLRLG